MEIDLAQISSSNESPRSPHQRRLEKQNLCDGWGEALLEAKTSRQACWEKAFLTQIKASSGQYVAVFIVRLLGGLRRSRC